MHSISIVTNKRLSLSLESRSFFHGERVTRRSSRVYTIDKSIIRRWWSTGGRRARGRGDHLIRANKEAARARHCSVAIINLVLARSVCLLSFCPRGGRASRRASLPYTRERPDKRGGRQPHRVVVFHRPLSIVKPMVIFPIASGFLEPMYGPDTSRGNNWRKCDRAEYKRDCMGNHFTPHHLHDYARFHDLPLIFISFHFI